jgi:hypothetical protein
MRPLRLPGPPEPYGAFATVDGLGGVAAPLLAGFAVTLLALVTQIASTLRYPDAALVLFALATALFLQVVQLNARARGYAVTPAQIREWYADFDDPQRQRVLAWELRHHRECWLYLVRRTRMRYNVAILALLLGSAMVLVPRGGLSALRVAAIAVLSLGMLIEILEAVDQWLGDRSGNRPRSRPLEILRWITHRLAPADPPLPRPPFPPPEATQPDSDDRSPAGNDAPATGQRDNERPTSAGER